MRISITAVDFKIDKRRLSNRIFESMRVAMLDATAEFLRVAAPAVPIDTGMARGSFLNMMHLLELNGRNVQVEGGIPTTPQRLLKNGKP